MTPPPFDDPEEPDVTTQYSSMPSVRLGRGDEDWALIRYIGEPIGEVILLRGPEIRLGRSTANEVCLPEPEVSRHHASLALQADDAKPAIHITDLGSTNGTFVNGRRLDPASGPIPLNNGDVLRVGAHAFKLKRLDGMERHYHETMLTQTSTDALTGVSNRSAVLNFLEKHTDLARRYRRPLSVALCDLDHFKDINDQHGHATGDHVLRTFGALALRRLRGSDLTGRIGGEEFLIVLPETQLREAFNVAEGLRKALMEEPFTSLKDGSPLTITCCFGIAHLLDRDPDGGSVLARADAALYRAKALGRNRVERES